MAAKGTSMYQSLVTYKNGKHHFEVAVLPDAYQQYREGKLKLVNQVLAVDHVFSSFTKGQIASQEELRSVFELKSMDQIFEHILKEGTLKQSASEHRVTLENHKKEVIQYIHEHYLNKQTKLPISVKDLTEFIEKHKIRIDDHGDISSQASDVAHKLLGTVVLKEGDITGHIELKAIYVPQAMSVIHKFSRIKNEAQTWFGDEMKYYVSIKPGDYEEFRHQLDKVTKSDYKFDVGQIESHSVQEDDGHGNVRARHNDPQNDKEVRKAMQRQLILEKQIEKQEKRQQKTIEEARHAREDVPTEEETETVAAM